MQAVVFDGARKVKLVSKALPQIGMEGDCIVKVEMTSICGTDLHSYRGEKLGLDKGTTMAHEMVGVVTEVGKGVNKVKVGDRIVSAFTPNCGSCWCALQFKGTMIPTYCSRELTCRCSHEMGARCYGWVSNGVGLEGCQAEYARIALVDTSAVAVPQNVPSEQALLCADVLPTGWFCAERAEIAQLLEKHGEARVAVVGCGPVGLASCAAAISLGATHVYAVDRIEERIAIAESLGAKRIPQGLDVVQYLKSQTDGRGVDAVLEAVGSPGALRLAFDAVCMGGVISSVGMHHDNNFSFTPTEGYNKNITYRNGRCPARTYMDELLDRLSKKDAALTKAADIITLRVPLSDEEAVKDAYKQFDQGQQLKVVVTSN